MTALDRQLLYEGIEEAIAELEEHATEARRAGGHWKAAARKIDRAAHDLGEVLEEIEAKEEIDALK